MKTTLTHFKPMYVNDKDRDNDFAKAINTEFGLSSHNKFLKPIGAIIASIYEKKDFLESIVKKVYDAQAQERDAIKARNNIINEKRNVHINKLFAELHKDITPQREDEIKRELTDLLMDTFWEVTGRNPKTGNKGHLRLRKLPISDFLTKCYNLISHGGKLWFYDREKAFYRYDSKNESLRSKIVEIIQKVGDMNEDEEFAELNGDLGESYQYNGNNTQDTKNILELVENTNLHIDTPFNQHVGYINCLNGVVKLNFDTRTAELIGRDPNYRFTYRINAEFNPEAVDTGIYKTCKENVGADQIDIFMQIPAQAIRDTDPKLTASRTAYLWIGDKGTGKTVCMVLLREFFGLENISVIPLQQLAENKFSIPLLEGKLINFYDELPEDFAFRHSDSIKTLTGDKYHYVEPKLKTPYNAVITATLAFASNFYPECDVSENDDAFWDRWEIIEFNNKHERDEKYLLDINTPENRSGFLNLVIEKLFEINEKGLTRKCKAETTYPRWKYGSSSIYQFIQERTEHYGELNEYDKDDFFEYYLKWHEETQTKSRIIDDKNVFYRTLYQAFPNEFWSSRPQENNRKQILKTNRIYTGDIKLPEPELTEEEMLKEFDALGLGKTRDEAKAKYLSSQYSIPSQGDYYAKASNQMKKILDQFYKEYGEELKQQLNKSDDKQQSTFFKSKEEEYDFWKSI